MSILIADDDKEICDLLEIYLNNEGFEVIKAYDGRTAYEKFLEKSPKLLILDVMMPRMDGLEVVKLIREDSQVPILMLSAKTRDVDKIRGLVRGADDYVVKPFNPLEVIARVKSLLRRSTYNAKQESKSNEVKIGPLIIRKDQHEVQTLDEKFLKLSKICYTNC